MNSTAAVQHYKEKFERLKKECHYIKESMDHAWQMLTEANRRLRSNGLEPVMKPPKKNHDSNAV